jgi:hypothetical protein
MLKTREFVLAVKTRPGGPSGGQYRLASGGELIMTDRQSVNSEPYRRIVPDDAAGQANAIDLAEEVRRRWISIASYYVAQRQDSLWSAESDDWRETDSDANLLGWDSRA